MTLLEYCFISTLKVLRVPELKATQCVPSSQSPSPLQDHNYSRLSLVHPLTKTTERFIVGDRFHDGPTRIGHKKATCKYHNMRLCPELSPFQSVMSEVINSKIKKVRLQSSSQQNLQHYFFYNKLMDYWHNTDTVQKQY